jgi:hypothetical protein
MKRKWILRSVVGLILTLFVIFLIVAFSLGSILKRGVEKVGPTATQVDVKLKSAEVWLLAWRVQLSGFVLGNPPGYRTPSSMEVGSVSVRFKPGSVFSDKLVVDSIKVKAPIITLEGGLRDNNLRKIEKNLDDYVGSSKSTKPERKLQVNDLIITDAQLQLNLTLLGGRTITLPVPDIHLTDLGTGPEGITAAEVGQKALHAELNAVAKEVAQNAAQTAGSKGVLKDAADRLKGLFH